MWDENLGGGSIVEQGALLVEAVDAIDQAGRDRDVDLGLCHDLCH